MSWTDYRPANTRALTPTIDCDAEHCKLQIATDPQLELTSPSHRAEFWPARIVAPHDAAQTRVFAHNPIAIAGVNPVRIIVAPHDSQGVPVIFNDTPTFFSKDANVTMKDWQASPTQAYYFADMHSTQPTQTTIELQLPNEPTPRRLMVTFTLNCKAEWRRCLGNLNYLRWWLEWWGRGVLESVLKKD
jgi:hypothetical protein